MKMPDTPASEAARHAALCALNVLDTPAEERFDRITRIAQRHFGVRIALVTLVDTDRQWFKSRQGLDATQTPRDISFCGHAILGEDIFLVPDTLEDPRFSDNPLVTGSPGIRFYAGAPLRTLSEERVGTLCVIDDQPRKLSSADLVMLRDLANLVETELAHTELRASQVQLRTAESRLRALIDTVADGILTTDLYGVVQTFNPAAERISGYQAAEMIGQPLSMLVPEAYRGECAAYVRSLNSVNSGQRRIVGTSREVVGRRKDSNTFNVELAISDMEIQGERMFTFVVRDITERKRVDRLKSEFVSTVNHELRTPLTAIQGALGLLQGMYGNALPEQARQLLNAANRNSERLTLLVNDILDLAKLDARKIAFNFEVVDLVTLTRDALEANEAYADRYGVRLRLGKKPQGTALVRGDEHRLHQVFGNLLSNASKYSPKEGEVVVSVSQHEARYRVSVQDRGRGLPAEFRKHAFQRFAQVDSSDARERGGTGLGLSISKAIVDRHGGTIDYESEFGVGTNFFFELPAWDRATA